MCRATNVLLLHSLYYTVLLNTEEQEERDAFTKFLPNLLLMAYCIPLLVHCSQMTNAVVFFFLQEWQNEEKERQRRATVRADDVPLAESPSRSRWWSSGWGVRGALAAYRKAVLALYYTHTSIKALGTLLRLY